MTAFGTGAHAPPISTPQPSSARTGAGPLARPRGGAARSHRNRAVRAVSARAVREHGDPPLCGAPAEAQRDCIAIARYAP